MEAAFILGLIVGCALVWAVAARLFPRIGPWKGDPRTRTLALYVALFAVSLSSVCLTSYVLLFGSVGEHQRVPAVTSLATMGLLCLIWGIQFFSLSRKIRDSKGNRG